MMDTATSATSVFEEATWDLRLDPARRASAVEALEWGHILHFRRLEFALAPSELHLLSPIWSDRKAKNISYDPGTGRISGANVEDTTGRELLALLTRYAETTRELVRRLAPRYAAALKPGRTSFRPHEIEGRPVDSVRKDDRLLHTDAFPSRPTRGARILRVFANVNQCGKPRVWHVGEPFEALAGRFLPRVRPALPGEARLEAMLGVTKGERTPYDHIMLQLHDLAKCDARYQREAARQQIPFPAGSTWAVFTDQVPHAAISGQFLLEQTFELPVAAQVHPELSPLRVLERLVARPLAA
jgi:hypothetical protein